MNNHQRIIAISISAVLAYATFYLFLNIYLTEPIIFASKPSFMALISLVGAILAALIAALTTMPKRIKTREIDIIKRVLSSNEKKILEEIQSYGEINQDALRHHLGWSKARVSTSLSNLDRARLIKKQRSGKTYKVAARKF